MKKILVFHGSPRKNGNSSLMAQHFLEGAAVHQPSLKEYRADELNLKDCQGCLRCNILQRCSLRGDDFEHLHREILDADVLVFASPVYFHHLTAPLKRLIDRFRSFVHVSITETGLLHVPHTQWNKDFVLLLSMGSSDDADARPILDLFGFITGILGPANRLHQLSGTRLALSGQISRNREELEALYLKLSLPQALAAQDAARNRELLDACSRLGEQLAGPEV